MERVQFHSRCAIGSSAAAEGGRYMSRCLDKSEGCSQATAAFVPWFDQLLCCPACPPAWAADNWFLQRLRDKSFREALIGSVVGGILLVAATAAVTVAIMQRWQHAQRGSRKRAEGHGSVQSEELQLLQIKEGGALHGLP